MNVIDQRNAEPAARVTLLGALVYFVKPKDILPDDMPGGIGFLDDGIIIYSVEDEFLSILKPKHMTFKDINVARYVSLLEYLKILCQPLKFKLTKCGNLSIF